MSRNTAELHPTLQLKLEQLKEACRNQGLIIGISECVRTVAEQDALYAKGRTAPGSIVTNAKGSSYSSMHQWGVAFDVYRNDGTGAYNDSDGFFTNVGNIGKSLGLEWGGNWTSIVDKPHFQLPDWGSTPSKLKASYGTPDKFMATWGNGASAPSPAPSQHSYSKEQFIREVQFGIGAKVDGIAGNETISKTITISARVNNRHGLVRCIQQRLNSLGYDCGAADCIAGNKFTNAVKAYQKANGCVSDGEITAKAKTWKKLLGMA